LVAGLPVDFPATVLVVLHVPTAGTSALPVILDRSGPLPVRHARDGDKLLRGHVLVAPPDQHLIVYDDAVTLSRGPKENGHRPAVDVLFRSAAKVLGSRVIGVILSGALDDGTAGMVAITLRGGIGVVQDPAEALHESMPKSARDAAALDLVMPAKEIPQLLASLVGEWADDAPAAPSDLMSMEAAMAELDPQAVHALSRPGTPAGFACPDCHGSLFQIAEGNLVRFRCRVGHAWSPDSLIARQSSDLESALWMALRSLEEKAALSRELGDRASERGHRLSGEKFDEHAVEALEAAELVRGLIADIGAAAGRRTSSDPL
jgi:two-component system chemotaxis response regulator CheB